MAKLLNKIFYILKNIMLPVLLAATIYITMFMYQRLEKDILGANFLEFLDVILPFLILITMLIINTFLKHNRVRYNMFYNITSFVVTFAIAVFCYRALFDKNMLLWYKYTYEMNFNYFADQLPTIKVMLYGLSLANLFLIIYGILDKKEEKKTLAV